MRVLVTGAAGYIGSHTVLELIQAGHEVEQELEEKEREMKLQVHCVDNCVNAITNEKGEAVSLLKVAEIIGEPVLFSKVDIGDESAMEQIFQKENFECVIHLAALKGVQDSIVRPLEYYANNIASGLTLLRLCRQHGVRNLTFASSVAVYGQPEKVPVSEDAPVGQGITTPYGQTKFMMEQILKDVAATPGEDWNIIVLRFFNPVGAHVSGLIGENSHGVPNHLMPYVSQVAIGKLPHLTIFGDNFDTPDGTSVRDYIHVVDLGRAHVKALERMQNEGKLGLEVYNLGSGSGYSVKQMITAFEKACGKPIPTKMGTRRAGDVSYYYCDTTRALEQLGWKAEFGLDEMCRDLWRWQTANPDGFRRSG